MEADINEPGHEIHDDDEIVADLLNHEEKDKESSDEADSTPCVTAGEAFDVLDVTLHWLEQRNADVAHILLFNKWHTKASVIRSQSLSQASILSYF